MGIEGGRRQARPEGLATRHWLKKVAVEVRLQLREQTVQTSYIAPAKEVMQPPNFMLGPIVVTDDLPILKIAHEDDPSDQLASKRR